MNELQDISPDGVLKLLDEHAKCGDLMYFYQRHVTGKPSTPETRQVIKEMQQMDRILKDLKKRRKCI